ncbi:MAG: hypothetical protein IH876_10020 [Gemmatimonadetes bacterium]|nr:hypothetical protein [Gemmatimonadota bacterium]
MLEGTVRTDRTPDGGGQVRITPQLIRASDDTHLWSEIYTADLVPGEIFRIQTEIAERITQSMDVVLLEPERQVLAAQPTENLDAYDAYLRGRALRGLRDRDNIEQMIQEYERAVQLDPSFGVAYALLSYARMYHFWFFGEPEQVAAAKDALDRAVEIAPDHPETHLAQGYFHYCSNLEYEPALEHFRSALVIRPNDALIHLAVGLIQRRQGHFEEAASSVERAVELDPRSIMANEALGEIMRALRRFDDAKRYYGRAISIAPQSTTAYGQLFNTYLWSGDSAGARRFADSLPSTLPADFRAGRSAVLAWYARDFQAALDVFLSSAPGDYGPIGRLYRRLGRPSLARAYGDSLRSAAQAVLERIERPGLPLNRRRVSIRHARLGIAYALLGDSARAVAEGEGATALYSLELDAEDGDQRVRDLVLIYTLVGNVEAAIDQLELLMSIPGEMTAHWLRLDPRYDPLRDNPRFQALLAKYEN